MLIVPGLYETGAEAIFAAEALRSAGLSINRVALICHASGGGQTDASASRTRVKLAGVGVVAARGIEEAVGESIERCRDIALWFTENGLERTDADVLAEGVRRGGAVVLIRPPDGQEKAVRQILLSTGCVELADRRAQYQRDGWEGFDPGLRELDERQLKRERRLRHQQPLVISEL